MKRNNVTGRLGKFVAKAGRPPLRMAYAAARFGELCSDNESGGNRDLFIVGGIGLGSLVGKERELASQGFYLSADAQ